MSEIVIRQLEQAEKPEVAYLLLAYAFMGTPPLPGAEDQERVKAILETASVWALFENGEAMSIACSSPMTQNVRGDLYPAGGVWGVASHPAGRRKGYVREVMIRLLADTRAEGQFFSMLYAFRESFYERLGYIQFPKPRLVRFSPQALAPLLKRDLGGTVELLSLVDGEAEYLAFMRKMQPRIHGLGIFGSRSPVNARFQQFWLALARVDGKTTGVMAYNIGGPDDDRTLNVDSFYYDDSRAKYLLLEWLARHADQVKNVEIRLPPFEYPETWLSDLNVTVRTLGAPLGRVLDVSRLNGLPTGVGGFSARIHDPQCPWNEGCYRLESVDGRLQVEPVNAADCDLSIQALTTLVYGTHDTDDFQWRGWGSPSPKTQAAMRALFPRALPHLHEKF